MNFKNRKSCHLWCDTHNRFHVRIKEMCFKRGRELILTGDPRLIEIGHFIQSLGIQHCDLIRKRLEQIRSEFDV